MRKKYTLLYTPTYFEDSQHNLAGMLGQSMIISKLGLYLVYICGQGIGAFFSLKILPIKNLGHFCKKNYKILCFVTKSYWTKWYFSFLMLRCPAHTCQRDGDQIWRWLLTGRACPLSYAERLYDGLVRIIMCIFSHIFCMHYCI